jgi:hypothetical protein
LTAVCITGMHRSGTSLVARLLNLCGLYLGPDEELMPASPDNADGYWENLRFVEINDALLSHLNASWYSPPSPGSVVELQRLPLPLVQKAQELIQGFSGRKVWGWKDPRSCLTLPFWRQHVPDLKVINCIRNPLEIADSLAKRDGLAKPFSLELWHTYYQRLRSAAPDNLLITHYDVYFSDPQQELSRLLDFIGVRLDAARVSEACVAVKLPLRHNRATLEYLLAEGVPLKVLALYVQMCLEAGPVYMNALQSGSLESPGAGDGRAGDLEYSLLRRLADGDPVVEALAAHLARKEQAVQDLKTQVRDAERELAGIKGSRAWHFVEQFKRLRTRFVPGKS